MTRLSSLDRGIEKPDMAPTLLNSVFWRLATETLIETLIEWVKCNPEWVDLFLGQCLNYPHKSGSHFASRTLSFRFRVCTDRAGPAYVYKDAVCMHFVVANARHVHVTGNIAK